MKIRIKDNSVRYRLSISEVASLADNERLEKRTEFLSGTLYYAIERTGSAQMYADLVRNTLTLYVPGEMLTNWINGEELGIERDMPLANGGTLYLLLEKDLKCIDGDVSADQSDYFDNPLSSC